MAAKKPTKKSVRAVRHEAEPATKPAAPPMQWQTVPPPAAPGFTVAGPSADERQWAMWVHLAGFLGLLITLGNLIGPLIVWLIKRRDSDFINRHGKAAVNFQILVSLLALLLIVVMLLTMFTAQREPQSIQDFLDLYLGLVPLFLVYFAILIVSYVFVGIAATRAASGEAYRYPLSLPIIP